MQEWLPSSESIDRLWARRFADLPRYCGNELRPGMDEVEEWRDWTGLETTPDQLRIENFLDRHDLRRATLLHIGVGNSGLAKRFARRTRKIVGTTISPMEKSHGDSLGLANYTIHLHNKYHGPLPGSDMFDIIIDNNPSTFGCCGDHLIRMMAAYRNCLKKGGMIVTDREGLGWVVSTPGANARWKFDFQDWAELGDVCGFQAERIDNDIYILAHVGCVVRRPNRSPRRALDKVAAFFHSARITRRPRA